MFNKKTIQRSLASLLVIIAFIGNAVYALPSLDLQCHPEQGPQCSSIDDLVKLNNKLEDSNEHSPALLFFILRFSSLQTFSYSLINPFHHCQESFNSTCSERGPPTQAY